MVTDPLVDSEVKAKCSALYRQWAVSYKNTPGMNNVATLYKQLPQRKKAPSKETSKVLRETERPEETEDEEEDTSRRRGPSVSASSSGPTSSSHRRQSSATDFHNTANQLAYTPPALVTSLKKEKKSGKSQKVKPFNFEKEKPQINQVITLASIEATGLLNALKLINREKERVSENINAKRRFETCKQLRRQTYRYCSFVEDENYLGTLLNANDQLSDALILYEQLDKSFDYDSDSEDYDDPEVAAEYAAKHGNGTGQKSPSSPGTGVQSKLAGLNLGNVPPPAMPPRPPTVAVDSPGGGKGKAKEESEDEEEEEEDENDPFADRHAVSTPKVEADEPRW
jgi:LAS seventeen-binding protein 5